MLPANFLKLLLDATLQVLLALLKIVLLPFNLWVKSISNLSEQKAKGTLNISEITGLWPFISFCKRLMLDFVFDAVAFLSYPIGLLVAMGMCFTLLIEGEVYEAIGAFTIAVLAAYVTPVQTALTQNILVFLLLPVRKLIDWFKKPAQHVDLNVTKKCEKVEE